MKRAVVIVSLLLFSSANMLGLIVGSNTAVSRQATPTFPQVDSDNEMRGFAAFANGFTLAAGGTTCLFNSFFPVSGTITLNSGTLTLNRNLMLASAAQSADGGTIQGDTHGIELPDKIAAFSFGGAMTFDTVTLWLNSDVTLTANVTLDNSCIIEGQGYTIDLNGNAITIGNGATVRFKDVAIKNITSGSISCSNSASTLILEHVLWIQSGNYTFSQGKIEVDEIVKMVGGYSFIYQSSGISTIKKDATWLFDEGMTFSYDASAGTNISMEDHTATLHLYETTLYSNVSGLQLTKGTMVVEGVCPVESDAGVQADGITFGDGVSATNNLTVKIFPESGFDINSGFLVKKNV